MLEFFLARIHIDTKPFFQFIKPYLKEKVKEIQNKLKNEKSINIQLDEQIDTFPESLIQVTNTNDDGNLLNSVETTSTVTNNKSNFNEKVNKVKNVNCQKKFSSVKNIPFQSKISHLNDIQLHEFNLNNYNSIQNILPTTLNSTLNSTSTSTTTTTNSSTTASNSTVTKANTIGFMTTDSVVNNNFLHYNESLVRAYFAAYLNQLYSSSSYCSPSTSSSYN